VVLLDLFLRPRSPAHCWVMISVSDCPVSWTKKSWIQVCVRMLISKLVNCSNQGLSNCPLCCLRPEITKQTLAEKIAQLNAAIDDVSAQLNKSQDSVASKEEALT
jgi:hypothetical protein